MTDAAGLELGLVHRQRGQRALWFGLGLAMLNVGVWFWWLSSQTAFLPYCALALAQAGTGVVAIIEGKRARAAVGEGGLGLMALGVSMIGAALLGWAFGFYLAALGAGGA